MALSQHQLHRFGIQERQAASRSPVVAHARPAPHAALAPCSTSSVASCSTSGGSAQLNFQGHLRGHARGSNSSWQRASVVARAKGNLFDQIVYAEGYTEADAVKGVRVVVDSNDNIAFEYLVKWKVRSRAKALYIWLPAQWVDRYGHRESFALRACAAAQPARATPKFADVTCSCSSLLPCGVLRQEGEELTW